MLFIKEEACSFLRNTFFFSFFIKFWLHWLFVAAHRLSYPAVCGILVPYAGTETPSPALEVRFLTTEPPGKSLAYFLSDKIVAEYSRENFP